MKLFEFFSKIYWENGGSRSRSRNFEQAGAGATQKLAGSATLENRIVKITS
jgi:hypothetical protein